MMSETLALQAATSILVLVLVAFSAWTGTTLVQLKERVTRLETKINSLYRSETNSNVKS